MSILKTLLTKLIYRQLPEVNEMSPLKKKTLPFNQNISTINGHLMADEVEIRRFVPQEAFMCTCQ
jgi:hypothetical protein